MPSHSSTSRQFWIAFGLAALTVAAYAEVRDFEFVHYDDLVYIAENPHVQLGLGWEGTVRAFSTSEFANWNPLTLLSLQLDHTLHGADPSFVHLGNLAYHVLAVLGLFLALARMTGAVWPSAFAAAVFAVHPLHVESVAWASERKDVLSGFFFALTLWAYAFYVERPDSRPRYIAVAVALGLGLLAKPMLVTLPFVLLLLDYWPLDRLGRRGRWGLPDLARLRRPLLEKLPLLVGVALISVVTYQVQQAGGALVPATHLGLDVRAMNALESWVVYLGQAFWPVGLTPFYPYPEQLSPLRAGGCLLLLAALTAGAARAAGSRPYLLTGWLWYLGTLVPVIGLVQVGLQARADRYMYLPLVGLAITLAWGGAELAASSRARRRAVAVIATACLVAFALASRVQARHWKSSLALFSRAVEVDPENAGARGFLAAALLREGCADCARAQYERMAELEPDSAIPHIGLADILRDGGDLDAAIEAYQRGVRIDPSHARAHTDLGLLLVRRGRIDGAGSYLRRALALYEESGRLVPRGAAPEFGLGRLAEIAKDVPGAVRHYSRALELDPEQTRAHNRLGLALLSQGEWVRARSHLERSLGDFPDDAETQHSLGQIADFQHRPEDAIRHYRRAVAESPKGHPVSNNLAWLLATTPDPELRDPEEALRLASDVLAAMDTPHPAILDTLAAAYAAAGRFDEAAKSAEEAVRLADAQGDTALAEEVRSHLALYRLERPYVDEGS